MPMRQMAIILSVLLLWVGFAHSAAPGDGSGFEGLGAPASILERPGALQGGATQTAETEASSEPPVEGARYHDTAAEAQALSQTLGMDWVPVRPALELAPMSVLLLLALATLAAGLALRRNVLASQGLVPARTPRLGKAERVALWAAVATLGLLTVTGVWLLLPRQAMIAGIGHTAFAGVSSATSVVHLISGWLFALALLAFLVCWAVPRSGLGERFAGFRSKWLVPPVAPPQEASTLATGAVRSFAVVLCVGAILSALSIQFALATTPVSLMADALDALGVLHVFGVSALAPHEVTRYAQVLHTLSSIGLVTLVLAHVCAVNLTGFGKRRGSEA